MQKSRTFGLTYQVVVPKYPKESEWVDLWLPFPATGPHQILHALEVRTGLDYSVGFDPVYGNAILHSRFPKQEGPVSIEVSTTVTRLEWSVDAAVGKAIPLPETKGHFGAALASTRFVKITDEIRQIAADIMREKSGVMQIARAVYDHVLGTMSYDKSGDGWGQGSTEFACDIGRGNCTDFHSLFLGIARACGIPAQFEIGVALPNEAKGDISWYKCGYHCWATFYAHGIGWIPVDISEAALHEELSDYYFGNIDPNRFLLSRGRDIDMIPKQQGDPENFFTEPRLETDKGDAVIYEKSVTFQDA